MEEEKTIEQKREEGISALPKVNLVQCFSINQLAKESGLSDDFLQQACNEYQASNGKMGLPWFERGTRKGVFVLSFAEFIHGLEKKVLLG